MLQSSKSIGYEPSPEDEHFSLAIPFPVRFWFFLLSFALSLSCYIFVLYHLLFDRPLRQALSNHTIILLLVVNIVYELVGIPLFLNYFHHEGTVTPDSSFICILWLLIDEGFFLVALILVAWASFERYILIFHDRWLSTLKKRMFVHYVPLIVLTTYLVLFYACAILFPPCENTFDYEAPVCGSSVCLYDVRLAGMWDTLFHDILPILVIVVFNMALLFRVILQKRRLAQRIQWRKHRKMSIQLLTMSSLYFFLYMPEMIVELAELGGAPEGFATIFQSYVKFFSYYTVFLLPFVIALSLPDLATRVKKLFTYRFQPEQAVRHGPALTTNADRRRINTVTPIVQR